jgi:hypothetical protein
MLSDSHVSEPKIIVGLHVLNNSNLSWECEKCGMPNFATTFFNSTIETSNSFLTLGDEEGIQDSICKPSIFPVFTINSIFSWIKVFIC